MVNINIEIPDELHRQLRLASLLRDQTIKEYVIGTLAQNVPVQPLMMKKRR